MPDLIPSKRWPVADIMGVVVGGALILLLAGGLLWWVLAHG